jgi:RimJ/RimL family protein N-acetyltransferase
MPAPHKTTTPRISVRIDAGKYLIRTIKPDDASDRWAGWMLDPEAIHMLNMAALNWTKSDVVNYINKFDQRSRLLLGIFEKPGWTHIGIITIHIDHTLGHFLINLLIGEPEYRNKGVAHDIKAPLRDYFFETLDLNLMKATALARNHIIIQYLLKTGWSLDQTLKQHVKSVADGTMLDLCLFSMTRDAWRAWKKTNLV